MFLRQAHGIWQTNGDRFLFHWMSCGSIGVSYVPNVQLMRQRTKHHVALVPSIIQVR